MSCSILFQQVLAGYVFVLTRSTKAVGLVKGLQGISQLVFSFPGGYCADHSRRDAVLKLSGALGLVAAATTFVAVDCTSLDGLYVAFALWGLFAALQSPALEALFADARRRGLHPAEDLSTPYVNTIPKELETPIPGDPDLEHEVRSLVRWNAIAMVLRANKESSELGGHTEVTCPPGGGTVVRARLPLGRTHP